MACREPQCLYSRAIPPLPLLAVRPVQNLSACTVELYLYSPYRPYDLYRASVHVQGCTLPPFKQTFLSSQSPNWPWGPPSLLYNGYRVFPGVKSGRSVTLTPHPLLVPWSRKSRAIPLLPLWAVRPVQSLSACTV